MKIAKMLLSGNASDFDSFEFEAEYAISVKSLQQVMNVPMAAIQAIGRMEGVDIDGQSEYIDGNLLDAYADAYIRKLKTYFRRMTRSKLLQLDPEEVVAFERFCKNFKKSALTESEVRTWDDIDADEIRNQFCKEIKKKSTYYHTKSSSRSFSLRFLVEESLRTLVDMSRDVHPAYSSNSFSDTFDAVISRLLYRSENHVCPSKTLSCNFAEAMLANIASLYDFCERALPEVTDEDCARQKISVLRKVVHSQAYKNRFVNLPINYQDRRCVCAKRLFRPPHNHIFVSDDDIPLPNVA